MVDAVIRPKGYMDMLTGAELGRIAEGGVAHLAEILRLSSLAVLSCGSHSDDIDSLIDGNPNFTISLQQAPRGLEIVLNDAPAQAFVDGQIISGIRDHLFAVVRDIIYVMDQVPYWREKGETTTDIVFRILRNARLLKATKRANLVVCWGGHSISDNEYQYTKEVGYQLGLRGMDICTGCGSGAMHGPMKGATIGHAKQRCQDSRYIGISEPAIIAAEAPNAIVNKLVIMPDIEQRLEAFVRISHGIIVFPGGVGTAEEILYILGVLLDAANADVSLPLILSGPVSAEPYFATMDAFLKQSLGEGIAAHYEIIIDDPVRVAQRMKQSMTEVAENRNSHRDAMFFNWRLRIDEKFQQTFEPTHESMANLNLFRDQDPQSLAAELRRAFSGIVAGNIKYQTRHLIVEHGPFKLRGDVQLIDAINDLLQAFVAQKRMTIAGNYTPCYQIDNS